MKAWSSKRVIPREQLTAYERWELAALDEARAATAPSPAPVHELAEPAAELEPPVEDAPSEPAWQEVIEQYTEDAPAPEEETLTSPWPTAEELEAIQQASRQEGWDAGYAEGKAQAEFELSRLHQLADHAAQQYAQAEAALAPNLLDLAITIAEHVLRTSLASQRTLMLPAVREALVLTLSAHQTPRLVLHPEDIALVEQHLAGELQSSHARLLPDSTLSPGDCRLETPHGEQDLTLATRWRRVLAGLGREGDWMEAAAPFDIEQPQAGGVE